MPSFVVFLSLHERVKLSRWRNSSFYRCLVQFISFRKEVRVASSQRRAFLIQILFVNLLIFCMKKHSVVLHCHSWCASIPHSGDHNLNTLPFRESVCVTCISSVRRGRVIRYNFARIRSRVINPRYGFGFFPRRLGNSSFQSIDYDLFIILATTETVGDYTLQHM